MPSDKVELHLRYKDHNLDIAGEPDDVVKEILLFFSKIFPQLQLLSKLTLSIDTQQLLQACVDILAITPEGIVVKANTSNLKDQERILLHLTKAKLASMTGSRSKETMMTEEIASSINGKGGTVAGRLSELVSQGLTERVGKGEYRVTTLGLEHFINTIVPLLRAPTIGESS